MVFGRSFPSSWPGLTRPSTSVARPKTWMPATSAGMTKSWPNAMTVGLPFRARRALVRRRRSGGRFGHAADLCRARRFVAARRVFVRFAWRQAGRAARAAVPAERDLSHRLARRGAARRLADGAAHPRVCGDARCGLPQDGAEPPRLRRLDGSAGGRHCRRLSRAARLRRSCLGIAAETQRHVSSRRVHSRRSANRAPPM